MSDAKALDIAAIKARADKATAGPWSWEGSIYEHMEAEIVAARGLAQLWESDNVIPDADFIAHARTDIPDLIAALEAAERERDALKEAVKPFVVGDEAMANILWGDLPDSASMKITTPLGAVRAARRALEASK